MANLLPAPHAFAPGTPQTPLSHRSASAFHLYSRRAAEAHLSRLGLRDVRVHIEGGVAHVETDPRDLWRLVARREAVVGCLRSLGARSVSVDLTSEPVAART